MAMFSQRKSFFKGKLFYIVLLALFVFGIWLNQSPADKKSSDDVETDIKYPLTTDGGVSQGDSDDYNIMDSIIGKNNATTTDGTNPEENIPDQPVNRGYYLVKEVGGMVKVFYYDEEGKESLIRDTDIAFSLLSIADQALFQKGVIKHTVEELDELLQDFES